MNGRFCSIEETSLFLLKVCGLEGAAERLSNLPGNAEKKDFCKRCGLSLFKLLFENSSAQKQDNQMTYNLNKIALVYWFLVHRLECKMRLQTKYCRVPHTCCRQGIF